MTWELFLRILHRLIDIVGAATLALFIAAVVITAWDFIDSFPLPKDKSDDVGRS